MPVEGSVVAVERGDGDGELLVKDRLVREVAQPLLARGDRLRPAPVARQEPGEAEVRSLQRRLDLDRGAEVMDGTIASTPPEPTVGEPELGHRRVVDERIAGGGRRRVQRMSPVAVAAARS